MSSKEEVGKAIKQVVFVTVIVLVVVTFLSIFHKSSIKDFSTEKEPSFNAFSIFPNGQMPYIPIITSD